MIFHSLLSFYSVVSYPPETEPAAPQKTTTRPVSPSLPLTVQTHKWTKLHTACCPDSPDSPEVNNAGRNLCQTKTFQTFAVTSSPTSLQSRPLASLPPQLLLVHWFLENCYIHDFFLSPIGQSHYLPFLYLLHPLLSIDYFICQLKRIWRCWSGCSSARRSVKAAYVGIRLNLFHHAVKHACN